MCVCLCASNYKRQPNFDWLFLDLQPLQQATLTYRFVRFSATLRDSSAGHSRATPFAGQTRRAASSYRAEQVQQKAKPGEAIDKTRRSSNLFAGRRIRVTVLPSTWLARRRRLLRRPTRFFFDARRQQFCIARVQLATLPLRRSRRRVKLCRH